MTADSPASGLPQEAVEAATWSQLSEADLRSYRVWRNAQLRDALAAERAKVAALQQAVDKVRALHTPTTYRASWDEDRTICSTCRYDDGLDDYTWPCPTVALLPDVQADDRGTATPTPATTCADCGTTRTLCDAGLNTYDTRCCEQCGHGVT